MPMITTCEICGKEFDANDSYSGNICPACEKKAEVNPADSADADKAREAQASLMKTNGADCAFRKGWDACLDWVRKGGKL